MDTLELARAVRIWIDRVQDPSSPVNIDVLTASANGRLLDELARSIPLAPWKFGPTVLRAAIRQTGACKWCLARLDARVHQLPSPVFDRAHRALLGSPCQRCVRAARDEMALRVRPFATSSAAGGRDRAASERRGGRSGRVPSTSSRDWSSASSAPDRHSPARPCALCHQARRAVQARRASAGLTASAAVRSDPRLQALVAAALQPHRPVLAPTGVAAATRSR